MYCEQCAVYCVHWACMYVYKFKFSWSFANNCQCMRGAAGSYQQHSAIYILPTYFTLRFTEETDCIEEVDWQRTLSANGIKSSILQFYDADGGGMTMAPLLNSNDDALAQPWAHQTTFLPARWNVEKIPFQVAGRICQVRQPIQHCCTPFPGELCR